MELKYGIIQAIDEFGRDIVGDKRLINILADYGALENKATKRVLHALVELGIIKDLLTQSSDSLTLFKKEKIHHLCDEYGYQSLLVENVIDAFYEVLFGIKTIQDPTFKFEGFSIDALQIEPLSNEASITIIPELMDTEPQKKPVESFFQPVEKIKISNSHKYEQMEMSVVTNEIQEARRIDKKPNHYNPHDQFKGYLLPKIDLLEERDCSIRMDKEELEVHKQRIIQTLLCYDIPISKIEATIGPSVTLYEITLSIVTRN